MPWWMPYAVAGMFLFVGIFISALSRSGELKFVASDFNLGASAALSGILLVINAVFDKSPADFVGSLGWRLGAFCCTATVALLVSIFIARGIDESARKAADNPSWKYRSVVILGAGASSVLAALCLILAVSLK